MPNLNSSIISSLLIAFPPINEQKAISRLLKIHSDEMKDTINYKNKLEVIKKGLMQDLLTGKVRVGGEV